MASFDDLPTGWRPVALQPGQKLGRRYEIVREIGRGGMGVAYLAKDSELEIDVVLKILPPELAGNRKAMEELRREASVAVRLSHPNIVRIYTTDEIAGTRFVAMEYIEGETLASRLDREGRLSEEAFLRIALPVCDAVAHAHSERVIHRDLKPANIIVSMKGQVRVMDFGIARVVKDSTTRLTGKTPSGTLVYMAPEQIQGARGDGRSDIWSLGITFYEMLSGEPPFIRGDITHQILTKVPPPPSGVSASVVHAVAKALSKEPSARFASAAELKEALVAAPFTGAPSDAGVKPAPTKISTTHVGVGLPDLGHESSPPPSPFQGEGVLSPQRGEGQGQEKIHTPSPLTGEGKDGGKGFQRRSRAWAVAGGIALLLLLATGGYWLTAIEAVAPGFTPGEMVPIPAGEFMMGCNESVDNECFSDEKPYHKVYLDAFSIDKTEVTVGAYRRCVDGGSCSVLRTGEYCNWGRSDRSDHPVNCVDWNQAKTYCAWAGKRLPTEAEWEKAARGTDGRKYPWGNAAASCRYAVMDDGGAGCGRDSTWPVGSKPEGASPYDALDMAGNVWEWVSDWYGNKYYSSSPLRSPQGPSSGKVRVVRGGSWYDLVTSYVRYPNPFNYVLSERNSDDYRGFRCASTSP